MHTISVDLFYPGVPVVEKIIRTVAVYAFLLIGLRLAGKRELTQLNPFDLVVLRLLANTVQNDIIGEDKVLLGSDWPFPMGAPSADHDLGSLDITLRHKIRKANAETVFGSRLHRPIPTRIGAASSSPR